MNNPKPIQDTTFGTILNFVRCDKREMVLDISIVATKFSLIGREQRAGLIRRLLIRRALEGNRAASSLGEGTLDVPSPGKSLANRKRSEEER